SLELMTPVDYILRESKNCNMWWTHTAAWFMMKLQTPAGIKFYKCRFTDIYQGPVLVAPIYWKYTATLELWERPLAPAPWGNYPEWIVGSSLLDIALNKEWPKA
ncbi:hypothetical protein VBP99_26515, partial [Klebsiella pneumoniae]|nr:hypothetical protein [Klebsiella pneumoniae]